LEIQQLKHLIAAIEFGNLLKAAEECNISQSGLSRSIRSLEDRLGVQLLIRKSKGVEPTIFGLSLLPRARLILNEVERAAAEIRSIQSCGIGEIEFGITQNYGYYFMPEVLADLQGKHPGIRVNIRTGGFLDLVALLKIGAVDFVFGLLGPLEKDSELEVELLREHHSRVIARHAHPLALRAEEVTAEELAAARWATLRSEGFQRNFASYFSTRGLRLPMQAVVTDSIALIRQSIAAGDLLAVLPPDIVHREIDNQELVIIDCEAPAEQTHVGLVTRRLSLVTPQRKQITDHIRRRFGR
jgi:DNA-binding transcriptional LysR family regulator